MAARFELDANTIAYKDAKTLAVVFKAANERQIELKASDLAMAAFILSMTKVWCKAFPAGDTVRNWLGWRAGRRHDAPQDGRRAKLALPM
ncbi:MAG: hypothetical protein WB610_01880, partial [Rhodomicrobium sp.]